MLNLWYFFGTSATGCDDRQVAAAQSTGHPRAELISDTNPTSHYFNQKRSYDYDDDDDDEFF